MSELRMIHKIGIIFCSHEVIPQKLLTLKKKRPYIIIFTYKHCVAEVFSHFRSSHAGHVGIVSYGVLKRGKMEVHVCAQCL
jgi:hypothetical protein